MQTQEEVVQDPQITPLTSYGNLPENVERGVLVVYRSIGLGLWGALLRVAGMPLEKIALETNSGRVDGAKNQLRQAFSQVVKRGWKDPFFVRDVSLNHGLVSSVWVDGIDL